MSKQLRVGIVGMGIGRVNGRAIDADPRGHVEALCDLQAWRMDEFEAELGRDVRKYTDVREMCRDADIDAVFVGTENQQHVPVALEAVKADKHVMVTKPLADSAPAARKLVKAAEAAGVVNMMSLNTRFSPNARWLRERIDAGRLGEVYYARARSIRRRGIPHWNTGFVAPGGGALRDMGVHVLDVTWWLMGMPAALTASGVAGAHFGPDGHGYSRPVTRKYWTQWGSDDYAGGMIRFDNGAGVFVESFWAGYLEQQFQVELAGTGGGAQLRPLKLLDGDDESFQDTEIGLADWKTGWGNVAGHFIECCLDGVDCRAPLRHGLRVQLMLEAVLDSARKGKEVRVRQE